MRWPSRGWKAPAAGTKSHEEQRRRCSSLVPCVHLDEWLLQRRPCRTGANRLRDRGGGIEAWIGVDNGVSAGAEAAYAGLVERRGGTAHGVLRVWGGGRGAGN